MKLNLLVRLMVGFFLLQSVISSAEEARPLQADVVVEAQRGCYYLGLYRRIGPCQYTHLRKDGVQFF